jgi:transcriptional regulator with XRE-family HTH domain
MSVLQQTLSAFLREARGDRPMVDVTRAGGPGMGNISHYETGKRLPNVTTLKWLCAFYGVSFDEALHLLQQARLERDLAAVGD